MKRAILIAIGFYLFAAGVSLGDDTEIYGTVSISLQPNVLIIFDNSGSMDTRDVPGERYDPGITYTGSYSTNAVYRKSWWQWNSFANHIDDLNCAPVKTALETIGYCRKRIRGSNRNYVCGGGNKRLRTGNYMNYDESGYGETRTRISVAKEVITNLINDTDDVRFGLMNFNSSEGGHIVDECGTAKATLISSISGFTAETWTPLAETLAEAGLYFAGMESWFNSGVTYTSPMEERCQKNYIILMTDGYSTQDRNSKLTSGSYINGDTIGDYDQDGNDPGSYDSYGSDYLDDVAGYLYERDCNPTLGTGTSFEKQNITVYTIGFLTDHQLLQDAADNGGGEYFVANNISGLSEAFEEIMANISEQNAAFVAPVVPVSRLNRAYSGDYVYMGFFKPQQSGRWLGNLKKYGLNDASEIVDVNGNEVTTPDGMIKSNAQSYWSSSVDGPAVEVGGAGEVLLEQTSRSLYTYMETQSLLTHTANAFSTGNSLITNAVLDVISDAQRTNLIDNIYDWDDGFWILGDILHSEPAVVHYSSSQSYVFVGTNDGIMHCFDDNDGHEVWGFIPPDQLGRLSLLLNADHDYFIDGSIVVYEGPSQKILFFGERRGGDHYYALDVTTPTAPNWLYKIGSDILGGGNALLGQSWCKPEIAQIAISSSGTDTVFLMAGGYDNNQDADTPASSDSAGRAVFAVKVTDGTLSSLNINAGNYSDMTHCIVDVSAFDPDGDDIVNRVYAGDLGGHVFAFEDDDKNGTWSKRKLFATPANMKIFYAPDAVKESYGEMIFFGTGDRADPGETTVVNRIYAVKNNWGDIAGFTTLAEADLVDVTADLIQLGTDQQKEQIAAELESAKGWYIKLENPGEKVVSTPVVFAGAVFFTTYTPGSTTGDSQSDPCAASDNRGVARLYAVDYLTGGGVFDWDEDVGTDADGNALSLSEAMAYEAGGGVFNWYEDVERDADGNVVSRGKRDRSKIIGTAIPSSPVFIIAPGGPKILISAEGGVPQEDPGEITPAVNQFYWRQVF